MSLNVKSINDYSHFFLSVKKALDSQRNIVETLNIKI